MAEGTTTTASASLSTFESRMAGCLNLFNPCVLHLQKMDLELKCPLCLNLFNHPMLLPCDHLFCSSCITDSMSYDSTCPACKLPFISKDLRAAPYMETIVSIYKCMSASLNPNLFQQVSHAENIVGAKNSSENPNLHSIIVQDKSKEATTQMVSVEKDIIGKNIGTDGATFNHLDVIYNSPLFASNKGSDNDSNDPGCIHKEIISSKRNLAHDISINLCDLLEPVVQDGSVNPNLFQPTSDVPQRKSKRKKMNESVKDKDGDTAGGSDDHMYVDNGHNINSSESESTHVEIHGVSISNNSTSSDEPFDIACVFCHSSKITEASGSMLHYSDGNAIASDQVFPSNIIHVHKKCIDWAPQVYFEDDTAKNLESEILRASKIKCTKCGRKGAALGCYSKSCRKSFHPRCAVDVPGCKWDDTDFLLLCPTHSSHKFPKDRVKKIRKMKHVETPPSPPLVEIKKSKLKPQAEWMDIPPSSPTATQPMASEVWTDPLGTSRNWIICGCALSSMETKLLSKFASMCGATVCKDFNPNVTHIITSTNGSGACGRTLKFLLGILSGKWILKIDWIRTCMEFKHPVAELVYEIKQDIHGMCNGPETGRIRVAEKAPPLFMNSSFYFSDHFIPSYKGYLEELIKAGDGIVVDINQLLTNQTLPNSYIIYSQDTSSMTSINKIEEAKVLAVQIGAFAVSHTWLLDSIAAFKLQPLVQS